jgi:hypothetical protein
MDMRNRENDGGWSGERDGWRGERERASSAGGRGDRGDDTRGPRNVDRGARGYSTAARDWSSSEGRGAFGDREDARYDRYRTSGAAGLGGAGARAGGSPFPAYDEGYGIYGGGERAGAEDDPAWPWSAADRGVWQAAPPDRDEGRGFPPPGYGRMNDDAARWRMQGQGWPRPTSERDRRTDWSAGPYADPTRPRYGVAEASRDVARTGKGPKGYTRSDERIREDIIERIIDNGLDASELEIDVKAGEVTLAGAVHQRLYKHRMEDIADSVSGVRDVHNQIRVKRQGEEIESREAEVMNPDAPPTPTMNVRRAAVESAGTHKS